MTYTATDESAEDGSPIELYLFENVEETFTYTSGNIPVLFNSRTYEPIPMKRTQLGLGTKLSASRMTITMTSDAALVKRYLTGVPATQDRVTIYRKHFFDGADETIVYWTGTVATVNFKKDEAKVAINPAVNILETAIPRRTYSYPCNHVLYDTLCTVDKEQFRSDVEITAISNDGRTLSVTNAPAWPGTSATDRAANPNETYFNGGYSQSSDGLKYRMTLDYTVTGAPTATIQVPIAFEDVQVGDTLKLFAGCDHSPAACHDKFDNIPNYGGFPHVPGKNPFETGIIT